MRSPFPTLDELHSTDTPVRATRNTGVLPVQGSQEGDAPTPTRSTNTPVRADLLALGDAILKQPSSLSPFSLQKAGQGGKGKIKSPFPEYQPIPQSKDVSSLDAIHAEAEAIRLKAIQDAERIREQAHREGYQRGYEQGYADGEHHARQLAETQLQNIADNLRAQVEQVIQNLQAQYESYLQNAEAQMLELALEVARKIVREELKIQPDHALAIVRDALRRVQGFAHLRIRVNPLDLELIRQNRAALLHIVDGVDGIEIVEDRRVDPGGCIIETDQGVYDARIRTQLSELERAIRDAA